MHNIEFYKKKDNILPEFKQYTICPKCEGRYISMKYCSSLSLSDGEENYETKERIKHECSKCGYVIYTLTADNRD